MRRRPALRRLHENPKKQTIVQRRASGEPAAERAEPARKLNMQVRKIIERLPHDDDYSLDFFCECGCCEPVRLTIAEYDALEGKPAYLAGHPAAD
jgi:hypothetical protein